MEGATREKTWEKTRIQFLLRHKSGAYYARCYGGGKEYWEKLNTTHFQVAQARLPAALKKIRSAVGKNSGSSKKPLTFSEAAAAFMCNPSRKADAKASTIAYTKEVLAAIYATWPDLAKTDVRKITEAQCRAWAVGFSKRYSASRYNSGLSVMRRILNVAIREGACFTNPAEDDQITRRQVRSKKPDLPSGSQFSAFAREIAAGGGRFSADCADFVKGIAFTGMRRGEARWLLWSHLAFSENRIRVVGDPHEGTKNREERFIPMIADAKALFMRMKEQRQDTSPNDPVFSVNEAQKAM